MPLDIPSVTPSEEDRLAELGITQTLDRSMSGRQNFAVSFTIISILSGCLTMYGFGMNTGGPALIMWGWLLVGLMTLFVGKLAETFGLQNSMLYFVTVPYLLNAVYWFVFYRTYPKDAALQEQRTAEVAAGTF